MKKSILILMVSLFYISAAYSQSTTTIKWHNQDVNLGEIKYQVPQKIDFTFTNTGREPFIISDVKTTCGCTVAQFPKEPIAPGASGTINALYTAGTKGVFHKSLTVIGNMPEKRIDLNIRGEVK